MKRVIQVRTLFLDIGGVLLTDGWGRMPANGPRRTSSWTWPRWRIAIN